MESLANIIYTCKCGNKVDAVMKASVNFMDTNGIKGIITGDIMINTCEKCGGKSFLDRPMLYRDTPNKRFIWYLPIGLQGVELTYDNDIQTVIIRDYKEFSDEIRKINALGGVR